MPARTGLSAQQRNYFNFGNIKKSHSARSREYGSYGKTVNFSFFKNYFVGMSRDIAMQKKDMFKTNDRVSFLIIFFRLLQYYVFVVLFRDVFALFDSFTREKKCIPKPNIFCTQRPFGNYWASAMFSGPDIIAKLSDRLKIIDPIFITCDDIGNCF